VAFAILSFHYAHDLAQGLGGGRVELWDAEPHADAVGHEARRAPRRTCEHMRREIDALLVGQQESGGQRSPQIYILW
jgi:hypothetical protein